MTNPCRRAPVLLLFIFLSLSASARAGEVAGGASRDASCRVLRVPDAQQWDGAAATVQAEVDTVLESQDVRVVIHLLDGDGVAVSNTVVEQTVEGTANDAIDALLPLVDLRTAGEFEVEALVFDAGSEVLQDRCSLRLPHPESACATYEDFQQPLFRGDNSLTSDEETEYEALENLIDESGSIAGLRGPQIRRLRWWGISLEFDGMNFIGPCSEDDAAGTPFVLRFYEDSSAIPGALIATRTGAVAEIAATGELTFPTGTPIMRYSVEFAPVDSTDVRWISVRREPGPPTHLGNACEFLWTGEEDLELYDNFAYQRDLLLPDLDYAWMGLDLLLCVDASSIFLDGFESGDTSAW